MIDQEMPPTTIFLGQTTSRPPQGLKKFLKFGIVGASGLVVNLTVFTIVQRVLPDHITNLKFSIIYTTAFLCGGISNYLLNRIWTVRSPNDPTPKKANYLSVSLAALAVGLLILWAEQPYLGQGFVLWFVSTAGAISVNYFANTCWAFDAMRTARPKRSR